MLISNKFLPRDTTSYILTNRQKRIMISHISDKMSSEIKECFNFISKINKLDIFIYQSNFNNSELKTASENGDIETVKILLMNPNIDLKDSKWIEDIEDENILKLLLRHPTVDIPKEKRRKLCKDAIKGKIKIRKRVGKKPKILPVKDIYSYTYKTNVEDHEDFISIRDNLQDGVDNGEIELYETYIPITINDKIVNLPLNINISLESEGNWTNTVIISAYFPEGYKSKFSKNKYSVGDVMIVIENNTSVVVLEELFSRIFNNKYATSEEKKGFERFGHKLLCAALKVGLDKNLWTLDDRIDVNVKINGSTKLYNYYEKVGFKFKKQIEFILI